MGKRSKSEESESDVDADVAGEVTVSAGFLAQWRLVLVIAVAGVTTGSPLVNAASTGVGLDMALLRSFGIAFVTWVALGKINNVLGQAAVDQALRPAPRLTAVPDWKSEPTSSTSTAPVAPNTATVATADHEDTGRAA